MNPATITKEEIDKMPLLEQQQAKFAYRLWVQTTRHTEREQAEKEGRRITNYLYRRQQK